MVVVSSSAHQFGGLDLDDIDFTARPYDGWSAYGQSKTANILFTVTVTVTVTAAERWR